MDKYRQLRELVTTISAEIIGMSENRALVTILSAGLKVRYVVIDGESCMITADVKMDRIGLVVLNGKIVDTRNG